MNIADLELNSWICLSIGGQYSSNLTYIRLDYSDREFKGINGTYLGLF